MSDFVNVDECDSETFVLPETVSGNAIGGWHLEPYDIRSDILNEAWSRNGFGEASLLMQSSG